MNIVTLVLAGLFGVVAVVRAPTAIRNRKMRSSHLTVIFAAPGLLLLNVDIVHSLIRSFPWAAGAIRVAPFVLALFALWSLGEAAVSAAGGESKRGLLLEPLIWCVLVVAVFQFVQLEPLAEVFTIVHAVQLPGLVYTLIYYTGAGWFAGRMAYRVLRVNHRGAGYLFLGTGGVLIAASCFYQYALLIPIYAGSPLTAPFYQVFDLGFFTGALLVVIGLQIFAAMRRVRRIALQRMVGGLASILQRSGLPSADPAGEAEGVDAYAVFAYLVSIDDYAVQRRIELSADDLRLVQAARRWVSKTLPTLARIDDYTKAS